MTGDPPKLDRGLVAGVERGVTLTLKTLTVLMDAIRDSLTPTTPPTSLRACLRAVSRTLRLVAFMERRPAAYPNADQPQAVRADAEIRDLVLALREQAEALTADLTRLLRTPRARRAALLQSARRPPRR